LENIEDTLNFIK